MIHEEATTATNHHVIINITVNRTRRLMNYHGTAKNTVNRAVVPGWRAAGADAGVGAAAAAKRKLLHGLAEVS